MHASLEADSLQEFGFVAELACSKHLIVLCNSSEENLLGMVGPISFTDLVTATKGLKFFLSIPCSQPNTILMPSSN